MINDSQLTLCFGFSFIQTTSTISLRILRRCYVFLFILSKSALRIYDAISATCPNVTACFAWSNSLSSSEHQINSLLFQEGEREAIITEN